MLLKQTVGQWWHQRKILYLETNNSENTTRQNLQDEAKAVLRGKFTAIQSYLKKQEKSQVNNLTSHLEQLEKEDQYGFYCILYD